ncbi:PQQ-dependent sugar dehydrogenase [Roseimaritima ulvae]|uniref:Soluble aldose sugar dehydrogenase YliI n=1 Tax=Roseimaritima ulvae TaxID=980254 RepID=A0A5B9R445_9BACT|nr:PQQ-dependent sugar dehydrogenase [Roseimaritima ulvae]QEG41181.1 Soluble aldose sugar dehydrogenase YliI precursor [Roseimaritima ulvae]
MSFLKSVCSGAAAFAMASIVFAPTSATAQTAVNELSEAEKRSGWELLFDGESADAWRNYQKDSLSDGWQVVDGALVRAKKGAGDIVSKQSFDAFELLLDYKISPEGNSGLMFHVTEDNPRPWHSGPEIQIQDNVDGHDPQKAGWLYQLYRPAASRTAQDQTPLDATRPAGQWNQIYLRIAPQGCEVCLNGVRYYTFKIGSKDWKQKVAASKFAKYEQFGKAGKGHICLQDHGDRVAYRNIKVRRIAEDGSVPQPIDGKLGLKPELAFPNLQWEQREAVNDAGKLQRLRIIELTYPQDGSNRLFAASQHGEIWSFDNDPKVEKSHLVIDLRSQVAAWDNPGANEQGLLGLAMHPEFKSNQKFYVYYSDAEQDRSLVSEFTMSKDDPNKADPKSERVLMEIAQPYKNHNGGSIEFGPDGYLYIGLGDGGFRNDPEASGQDRSKLLGSILRIDVDQTEGDKPYGIPSDNPFVGNADARAEIYAYGIRNPWRLAFDRETGDLWMGDVGQELWEEINVIRKGGNYGWSRREGTNSFGNRADVAGVSDPIDPVWQYDHRIGRSVTGGRVYRSQRLPQLNGKYLYADYVTGVVWALSFDDETKQVTRNEQVIPEGVQVLAFGEDANGEIYYCTESTRGDCIYRFAK